MRARSVRHGLLPDDDGAARRLAGLHARDRRVLDKVKFLDQHAAVAPEAKERGRNAAEAVLDIVLRDERLQERGGRVARESWDGGGQTKGHTSRSAAARRSAGRRLAWRS